MVVVDDEEDEEEVPELDAEGLVELELWAELEELLEEVASDTERTGFVETAVVVFVFGVAVEDFTT